MNKLNYVLVISLLISPTAAYSAAAPRVTQEQVAVSVLSLGHSMGKMIVDEFTFEPQPDPENLTNNTVALLDAIERKHKNMVLQNNGNKVLGANTKMVAGIVALGFMSGGAAVPAAIAYYGIKYVTDKGVEKLNNNNREQAMKFLLDQNDKLLEGEKLDWVQLQQMEPKEIRDALSKVPTLQEQIIKRFPPDETTNGKKTSKEFAEELMVNAIKNVAISAHEKIHALEDKFDSHVKDTIKYREVVDAAIEDHKGRISNLESSMEELRGALSSVQASVEENKEQIDILSDFTYSRMTASERVRYLEDGFMADRFSCKAGESAETCKQKKDFRTNLIAQNKAEAKVQKQLAGLQEFSKDLGNVTTILANTGILADIPELSTAISVTQTGIQAYAQFATGNVLGGLASLSGAFGGGQDPDAARHEAMMQYLEQQFAQINAKLDAVLENQKTILDSIQGLSNQLNETYVALDERLGNMQWEQRRIAESVQTNMWWPWAPCATIINQSRDLREDPLDFNSLDDLRTVRARIDTQTPNRCLRQIEDSFTALEFQQVFGSNFSINALYDRSPESIQAGGPNESPTTDTQKFWDKSQLQAYVDNVVTPTNDLLSKALGSDQNTWLSAFLSLSYPQPSSLPSFAIELPENPCGIEQRPMGTVGSLLCSNDRPPVYTKDHEPTAASFENPNPGARAFEYLVGDPTEEAGPRTLRSQVSPDVVRLMAEWALPISRLSDVRHPLPPGDQNVWMNSTEMLVLEIAKFRESSPEDLWTLRSQILLHRLDMLLTLAIASHSKLFGTPTIEAVLSTVMEGQDSEFEVALGLLANNGYLRKSVASRLLRELGQTGGSWKVKPLTYNAALRVVNSDPIHATRILSRNFEQNERVEFSYPEGAFWPQICLVGSYKVCERVPSATELWDGTIHYPAELYELIRLREITRERSISYVIYQDVEQSQSELLSRILKYSQQGVEE